MNHRDKNTHYTHKALEYLHRGKSAMATRFIEKAIASSSEDPEDDDAYTPAKGRGRRKSGHGKDAEFVRYKDRAPRTPLKFLRKDTQRRIVNLQQRHKRLIGRGDIVKAAKTLAEIGVLQDVQHRAVAQAERAMSSGSYVHSKAPSYRTPWQKA